VKRVLGQGKGEGVEGPVIFLPENNGSKGGRAANIPFETDTFITRYKLTNKKEPLKGTKTACKKKDTRRSSQLINGVGKTVSHISKIKRIAKRYADGGSA